MEVKVYRQASKERPDGTIVYKGEDTRPYVDNYMIMVADGLGGAAAIRHQKFDQDMFDPEKIVDVIMKDVYEDYSDERLAEYIKKAFEELYAVKDCYTENANNMKKSGYFGSRLVSAIILHELFYSESIKEYKYFSDLDAAEHDEKKQILESISSHFKELISSKLKEIAKKCNLVYESGYSGLALLGTTLCATLVHETEDSVECIYLTAGDSRPYAWREDLGLMQVIADEEGKDGGMTNYIRANEDKDFNIRAHYHIFAKPCIIFNATDGCFDSSEFISPMAFEAIILKSIIDSQNAEEFETKMTEFFQAAGKHDDSSTIAMKSYGYGSYEELKAEAVRRYAKLDEEYMAKMADLLDVDYIKEFADISRKTDSALGAFKERLFAQEAVDKWCEVEVTNGYSVSYNKEMETLRKQLENISALILDEEKLIADVIRDNYIQFLSLTDEDYLSRFGRYKVGRKIDKIDSFNRDFEMMQESYVDEIVRIKEALTLAMDQAAKNLDELGEISDTVELDMHSDEVIACLEDIKNILSTVCAKTEKCKSSIDDIAAKCAKKRKQYVERNRAMAAENEDKVQVIVKLLINDIGLLTGIRIKESEKTLVQDTVSKIEQYKADMKAIEEEKMPTLLQESKIAHWNTNYIRITRELIYDNSSEYKISSELADEVREQLDKLSEDVAEIKEKADKQKELFDMYDKGYYVVMEGEQ